MFRIRAYLTNICLGCFDLALTAVCYIVVATRDLHVAGQEARLQRLFTRDEIVSIALVLIVWLAFSTYFGMYRSRRLDSPFADSVILLKVGFASWIVLEGTAHLVPLLAPTPSFLVRFCIIAFLTLAAARSALRLIIRELRRRGLDVKEIVLIASPDLAERLVNKIERRANYGYHITRQFIYFANDSGNDGNILGDFRNFGQSTRVDDVIIGLPSRANDLASQLVAECENLGINVRFVPDLFPLVQTDTQIYDLDGIPLVNIRLYPTEYFGYVVFKRVFDVLVSLAVLILLSPLYFLIAVAIKLTSAGPLLFSQERVGLNGRKFRMLKFRTMHQHPSLDPDSHWTVPNDPHVTPLGRWLRRSSLDELPQFLNVLKGDMSIVGPRPERPFFLEKFRQEVPEYMARHYVKSGITGWAQVNGWRGDTAIAERVAHDLYYIRNWGLRFDIKILFLTLKRNLFQGNAY